MKKTLTVTLGGRVFILEEDGFEMLDTYLKGLRQNFSDDVSVDELMVDIEIGVCEKFSDILHGSKQVITLDDVQSVIALMGRLEEITAAEADHDDRGPAGEEGEKKGKKSLYRNGDDIVIAGVCSGLAAYFGTTATVMRILFIIFGLMNGVGILIYLVLWAAVPLAVTSAQKLEMRGKPLNVDEIEQMVKDKANKIRDDKRLRAIPAKAFAIIGTIFQRITQCIRVIMRVFGTFFCSLIGVCTMLVAVIGLLSVTVGATMLIFPPNSEKYISDIPLQELVRQPLYYVGVCSAYLLVLIPIIFLVLLALTLLRRKNSFSASSVAVLILFWIIAASGFALAARDIGAWIHERYEQNLSQNTMTRTFSEQGFTSLHVDGELQVKIQLGETYQVKAIGRNTDINRLRVTQKNGTLFLSVGKAELRPCFICFDHHVEVVITVPAMSTVTTRDAAKVDMVGFSGNVFVEASDASRVVLGGQFQEIRITERDMARVQLEGKAERVEAVLKNASQLRASALELVRATIKTEDVSLAEISPSIELDATSRDASRIRFEGTPSTTIKEFDSSQVQNTNGASE